MLTLTLVYSQAVAINRELKIGSDCSGYEGGPEAGPIRVGPEALRIFTGLVIVAYCSEL